QGRWQLEDSLKLSLRWARNSAFRPYWDGVTGKGIMTLPGEDTAGFEYQSRWALLELLQRQRTPAADFARLQDTQPYTLKFIVPVKQLEAVLPKKEPAPDSQSGSLTSSSGVVTTGSPEEEADSETQPQITFYQGEYRELFEKPSQTVLFIRFRLIRGENKERMTVPEFPAFAPKLNYDPQYAEQAQRLLPQVRQIKQMPPVPSAPPDKKADKKIPEPAGSAKP
ncbi:MAG: hypothetical protein GY862_33145, partial [Gammaproteobacteria bacterium]|nr:hypothetical protein [Gammaproteobacteria bacterium]